MLDKILVRGRNFTYTREATSYLFKDFQFLGLLKPQKMKVLYYLYAVTMIFIVCFLFPVMFILSYFFESSKMNISQFLTSLQVAINVCGLPLKFMAVYLTLNRQYQAMDIMDILDAKCHNPDEREKIHHCAVVGNRLTVFYCIYYCLYSLMTFVTSLIAGQPPYSLYMPIMDWRNSTAEFAVQSLVEYNLMNFVALHEVGYDVYAIIFVYIMRTHMQILVNRVRKLGTDPNTSNDDHYEQLIKCIEDHQNLLSLVDTIGPVISTTMFIQFTMTGVILGTTLINILIFADTTAQIASVIYFAAVLIQTTPCTYQATCLMYDCEELSLAIFHCEWFDKDKRFRKMMIFFMMRSYAPITLTAMKIFPLNLSTSLGIAKFSFSLYTLIKQMDFGQNLKN